MKSLITMIGAAVVAVSLPGCADRGPNPPAGSGGKTDSSVASREQPQAADWPPAGWLAATGDPVHKGKHLSEWLAQARDPKQHSVTREDSVRELAEMGPVAAPALGELLDEPECAPLAAVGLGRMGSAAKPALPRLMRFAESALDDKTSDYVITALSGAFAGFGPDAREAVPLLKRVVREWHPGLTFLSRLSLATALAKIAAPDDLIPWLSDSDGEARKIATMALGQMGSRAASCAPAVARLLKDRDRQVRQVAAETLGALRAEAASAVPALIKLLGARTELERGKAAEALGAIGPPAKDAVAALDRTIRDGSLLEPAFAALVKIGEPAVGVLIGLAESERPLVVRGARSPSPAEERRLGILQRVVREQAVNALGDIGPKAKAATPLLVKLLADDYLFRSVARALGKIGPEAGAAISALERLAQPEAPVDEDRMKQVIRESRRDAAKEALQKIRGR